MEDLTSEKNVETSTEYMNFCAHVMEKEMKRFNLDFTVYQSFVANLPGVLDVNFDIAYNRCAFMYKYTLCNIYFFKDCMIKFMSGCTEFKNLVSKWAADPDVRLCSLSCGPGLDYVSFMLALSSECLSPPSFNRVTLLSKHGAWRNTVGIVADSLEEGALSRCGIGKATNFKNVEVVQTNLLKPIPEKGLEALQNSNVILMVKTLNLTAPGSNEEQIFKTKLLELVSSLKPEATIFCIDTKPSLALFMEVLPKFQGKFLYSPDHLSFRVPVTFSEDYKEKHGCFPVVSVRGAFFVWQKLSSFEPQPSLNISPLHPLAGVKDSSESSSEKAVNENDDILNITKTLKDLILPNNNNLNPNSVGNIISDSNINDKIEESSSTTSNLVSTPTLLNINQPSSTISLFNIPTLLDTNQQTSTTTNLVNTPTLFDINQMTTAKTSLVNTPAVLEINKSASIQNLPTSQDKNSQINFNQNYCFLHSLKKSCSIDNSFLQSSPKSNLSFLGESDIQQDYPMLTLPSEETSSKSTPQHNATKKSTKVKNNKTPKSNPAVKPTSESKATQTEMKQTIPNSNIAKELTDRVKRLVSSLENEVRNNTPGGRMNCPSQELPNRSTNCSPSARNSDMDIKPSCCKGHQTEEQNPFGCCNSVQMSHTLCCAIRHTCDMHCCRSCAHRCHMNRCRLFCGNNINSSGASLAGPQIVIPLKNVSNEILMQIISAANSVSKPQ